MLAVLGGHVDAVSLLLEREANVDTADHQGLTALHLGVSALIPNYYSGTTTMPSDTHSLTHSFSSL